MRNARGQTDAAGTQKERVVVFAAHNREYGAFLLSWQPEMGATMSHRTHRRRSSLLAMIIAGLLAVSTACASARPAAPTTLAIRQQGALNDGPRADAA